MHHISFLVSLYFIIFILYFHGEALKFQYTEDVLELTLVAGLFIGYPLAYPYFWLVFGILHNRRVKKNMINRNLYNEKI